MESLIEQREYLEQMNQELPKPLKELPKWERADTIDCSKSPQLNKLPRNNNNTFDIPFMSGMVFGIPVGLLLSIPLRGMYNSTALATLPSALIWSIGFYSTRSLVNYIFNKMRWSTGFVYEAIWVGIVMYSLDFDYMTLAKAWIQRV